MDILTNSRRAFLKGGGALVVSFSVARHIVAASAQAAKTVALDELDGFIAIDATGAITVYSGKVDLGTGVRTALAQIVADELDVPMARVSVVEGDTALTPDQGPTYGSLSIQSGGLQLRQAAATARQALLSRAAQQLGAKPDDLAIADGAITAPSGRAVTYAELFGGRSFSLKVDKQAPVKKPEKYKLVGTSVTRVDIPDKVMGRFVYMQDFHVPGMLHGRVIRPQSIGGTLDKVDESAVRDMAGVKVVRLGNFLGVVAPTEWTAISAARRLQATWSNREDLPDQSRLWEHVRASAVVKDDVTSNVGDPATALEHGARRLKATYDFAIHTHGSIGPSCAVVEMKDGHVTCWSPSQATHNLRKQLAAMLELAVENVRVIYIEGSGCYGRNGHEDAAADAALLARETGKPVRVQWTREDEHGWDPKGPPTLVDLEGALDAQGDVTAWSSQFFLANGGPTNVKLIAAELANLPHEIANAPGNIQQNSALPYNFPNIRTVAHRLAETPLRPSWIRTPGRMQNTYANEAFFDELAAAAGADALEFRLRYMKDPRGIELLRRLAALAQWETRPSPKPQSGGVALGRGISYVKYELTRTYVGAVAEVEVDRGSGTVRVARFFVVHDCGQIINPDGVKSQIEGGVIQTVSRTLKEEVTFDRSRVTSLDWASYPILTFAEIPEIVIELIDRPAEPPWGAGEPTAAVVPSAISNAVFDAIGVRLRSIPYSPAKVRTALQRASITSAPART